jgi:hypothetical protein
MKFSINLCCILIMLFVINVFPQFVEVPTGIPNLGYGDADWGDYDSDGDLDLLVSGFTQGGSTYAAIFRNDNGTFTNINANISNSRGPVKWGDYDADGDLDFFIGGYRSSVIVSSARIYKNNNGVFAAQNIQLTPILEGDVDWGDYDNDGDLDLLYIGATSNSSTVDITRLYRNDSGTFVDSNLPFVGQSFGSVEWGDYDNDGDLDILFSGSNQAGSNNHFRIYKNDNGYFTLLTLDIPVYNYSKAAWCDYDNDGDLDFAVSGVAFDGSHFSYSYTNIYKNDNGAFTNINASLEGVQQAGLAWGDYDNDGDADLVIAGQGNSYKLARLYRNDDSTFTSVPNPFIAVEYPTLTWADYDNNGTLDLFQTGGDSGPFYSRLFKNTTTTYNTAPSAPPIVSAEIFADSIRFNWTPSFDNQTPQAGLSYNIMVGTSDGNANIMPGNSLINGQRKIIGIGNAQKRNSWTLKNLPVSICYFRVQAIDQSFSASEWSYQLITPVELSSFNGFVKDKQVLLKWITATELNNNGFEIQRKFGESEYVTIGFVRGIGTTTTQNEYAFTDKELPNGKYFYRLKQLDFNGSFYYSNEIDIDVLSITKFSLEQNYPNPFNPSTKISWHSPVGSWQTIKVYDILGNEVATLVDEYRNAGSYNVEFNPASPIGAGSIKNLASGIYFYQLRVGDPSSGSGQGFVETKKMILLK